MSEAGPPDLSELDRPPRRELSYAAVNGSEEQLIGEGGQAKVYAVPLDDPELPSRVAVKEPPGSRTLGSDAIQEFLSEAETWARLDDLERRKPRWHEYEHIVGIVDTGDDIPWIAMEYLDGGTLADRLESEDGGLPLDEALWIGECVCRGLKLAHTYGIAHLDLKPANVLFRPVDDGWDVPKIADWGLARVLFEHSGSMDARSELFGAPEQFEPDEFGTPDELTDVYQAGALVYALLTGEPPYTGSRLSLIQNVLASDPPVPPSEHRPAVPQAIDSVVLKALTTDKRDRLPTVVDLERALQTARLDDDAVDTLRTVTGTDQPPARDPGHGDEEGSVRKDDDGTEHSDGSGGAADEASAPAVSTLEGVGQTYAQRLSDAGIETVDDLAKVKTDDVANRVDMPARQLEGAASAASRQATFPSLTDVRGVGETYAEWLREAGIVTVPDLAAAEPASLRETDHIVRGDPDQWVENARDLIENVSDDDFEEFVGHEDETALTDIPGIGSTYAASLAEQGIDSVQSLANTRPQDLSDVDGASLTRATRWVERARDRVGQEGRLAPVTELTGIGPTYADRLRDGGIISVFDIVAVDPERLADVANVGTETTVEWCRRARQFVVEASDAVSDDLTDVDGIGEARAGTLADASVETPADLAGVEPAVVADQCEMSAGQVQPLIENVLKTTDLDAESIDLSGEEGYNPGSLTDVRGLGQERAEKLRAAGVKSPSQLANADPDRISWQTDMSTNVISKLASRVEDDPYADSSR